MILKDFIEPLQDYVDISATLQDVIDKMTSERLHHIVIVDNNKPVSLITERDFVNLYKNKISFESLAIDHSTKNLIKIKYSRLVEYALTIMLNNNIRKVIVVDSNEQYIGCVEQEDLIYFLEDRIHEKEVQLGQLIHPGNKAVLINEDSTLEYALEIMTTNNLTSLLVTSNEKAVGIISESDIIKLAQEHSERDLVVKSFMHSPIIEIEEYKSADDMVILMRRNKIRRVVLFNSKDEQYYILTSKDIANTIKGNYKNFIESKFIDSRDTFNALSEYIIELLDIDDEQVVFWTNSIAKANFDLKVDDNITKVIPKECWDILMKELLETHILLETIEINNRFFQIKGHYGTMNDDKVIKLFLNDITKVVQLTEQLKKENEIKDKLLYDQAKMAQLGEMISNISHQWRQPLNLITTSASGLQVQNEYGIVNENTLNDTLKNIEVQSQYLSRTIDVFRNFVKEKKEYQEVVLQDRIEMSLNIINASLKNNYIELINNINNTKPIKIKLILGELSQVLINIINNAQDIILENKITNPWIKIGLENSKNCIIITIEDNAGGIPEDILPYIFDPYFTTKGVDNGTGLGLDMSYKIVTNSLRGKLHAKNTEYGAKFFIELPFS